MAENITSVLVKPEATDLSLSDILYLIQGSGKDRDKKVKLSTLLEFFEKVTDKITIKSAKYTIEIDSREGTFSIYDPEGSAVISFGFNGGSKFSFTDDVSFEGGADIMGSAKVGGKVVVKDEEDNGVEIANTGITFGQDGSTKISVDSVETNQVIGSSGKFDTRLNVGKSLAVDEDECRVRVKTIVQNDMAVTKDLEVQGFLKSADSSFIRAHSESFIQLPFVDATTEAGLKNPSAIIRSQIKNANPLKGDIVMVRNMCDHNVEIQHQSSTSSTISVTIVAVGESILYAYNGSFWSKVW